MSNTSNITINDSTGGTSLVLAEVISANVGEALRDQGVLLATCDVQDTSAQPSVTASFPYVTGVTAAVLSAEYTATAYTQFNLDDVTAAATERTCAVFIHDLVGRSSVKDLVGLATADMTAALLSDAETSIGALLAGFPVIGTSAGVLSWANMTSAFTALRISAKQYAGNAGFALYPTQIRDLLNEPISLSLGLGRGFGGDELISFFGQAPGTGILRAQAGSFMGCPVLSSDKVPAASTVNSGGALYVWGPTGAIGVNMKWAPRIEMVRGTSEHLMGWNILGSIAMGCDEKRDALGVTLETVRA